MTAFKSVTDRGVDFILNSLYPSNYQRQNPADPLTLLQNRKAKTVGHTILGPMRALTRMILWAGVGALTPIGLVQHGSMCAVHTVKWMKHKLRKECYKEHTEWRNLKTRFVPFAQDLIHLGLFLLTLRAATTIAANKGILSLRIFHQLPGLFKMSWNAELAARFPEVTKTLPYPRQIAGQLELLATTVAAFSYTAFMICAAAIPAELLFCGSIGNAAEKTRTILGYALKNACGAVKEDGSCLTINRAELTKAFVTSWTQLLESIKTARKERIDIPYAYPLEVKPIMDYVKKHSERIRPELQAELVKNCRLVAETGELLRILLSESQPILTPPCPIEAGEYFPKIEYNMMMLGDSSPTRRNLNRSWMTGAIETMLGSAWLCPSDVKERPIDDKGALEDTLGNIDFFEGREVKGRLHQLTKPLRVVARTVYILAAITIIAPMGFLYHAGRIALAAVKIKKAPIGQHFRAGRTDGLYAVAGALFATGVALNIAIQKRPELLLRRWVPKASIGLLQPVLLITLGAMGLSTVFNRGMFKLFIERDLVRAAHKSHLFKQYFGLVSTNGSLLNYVEADSNEGLNFSLLSAHRLTYWMDLYEELRKLGASDIVYDPNETRPLSYIQKQYPDNQEILKLVERCRIINEVYNTLADQIGIKFWEMPPKGSCFVSNTNNLDSFEERWEELKNVDKPAGMSGEFANIYNRATGSCSPWAVLGVPYEASTDELRRARLKILLVVSPDKQTRRADTAAYTAISEALTKYVGEAYAIANDEKHPLHAKYKHS